MFGGKVGKENQQVKCRSRCRGNCRFNSSARVQPASEREIGVPLLTVLWVSVPGLRIAGKG
jgi:hypothetical protein